MSSYLSIAEDVLRQERRPLSAHQIMRRAYSLGIVPTALHGKTQFKTLHARIAEDILLRRERSIFVRTGPGRFFLRSLFSDPDVPEAFKREYPAPSRADQLRNFDVLAFRKSRLNAALATHLTRFAEGVLSDLDGTYESLASIEQEEEIVHLRVFVIVHRDERVVIHRRWNSAGDPVPGSASVGLSSFLKADDNGLFSRDAYGLEEAALRALGEQLHLTQDLADEALQTDALRPFALLYLPEEPRVSNILAAVVSYHCSSRFDPVQRFGREGPLSWLSMLTIPNDLAAFDPWSRHLMETGTLRDVANL